MALSQKHIGKLLVPWFCGAEWRYVYKLLYEKSDDSSKRIALEIIEIWKARIPSLPCGIEGTLIILEAMFIDRTAQDNYNLRLLLSSAIMRFLNISAAYSKFQGTFYATARKMNLPEWLINLRHDTAHSQSLPPLDLLDYALKFCFDWLYREYWQPYSLKIEDFVDLSSEMDIEKFAENLVPFLYNYCYISLLLHPYWDYKIVDDIPDAQAKRKLIAELNDAFPKTQVHENTSIKRVLIILWKQIERIVLSCDNSLKFNCFIDILLKDNVFLGNFENCSEVFDETFPTEIPRKFVFLWTDMLRNMHKIGMMETLITTLLKLIEKPAESHKRKWYAALWLSELGKAFSKCMLAKELRKQLSEHDTKFLMHKQLLKLLKKKCDQYLPEMKDVLDLSYLSPEPEILKNVHKIKEAILDKPNEYTCLFIPHLLKVNEKLNSESVIEQITELVKSYTTSEDDAFYFSKIFTVEDLNNAMDVDEEKVDKHMSSETGKNTTSGNGIESNPVFTNNWRRVTNMNFEKCAIGILPSQSTAMNPLLVYQNT